MKKIGSVFSLSETAARVGLSHAWVKKIEKSFKFPSWGSGQRGKKSEYNLEHIELFGKIVVLRGLGFALNDIKELYDVEHEIRRFLNRNFPIDKNTVKENVRYAQVYLLTNVFCGFEGIPYDKGKRKLNKKASEEIEKMYNDYAAVIKTVSECLESDCKKLETTRGQLEGIVGR